MTLKIKVTDTQNLSFHRHSTITCALEIIYFMFGMVEILYKNVLLHTSSQPRVQRLVPRG